MMKRAVVVYDSVYGNTEQVAQAIAEALGGMAQVARLRVREAAEQDLEGMDLLVVGSPTRAFRPTPAITGLLKRLPAGGLAGVKVAAFDTRISLEDTQSGFLRFLVNTFGYAAKPIAERLRKKGGRPAAPPEGFFVEGTEGPLKPGELQRAAHWAEALDSAD